MTGEGAETWVDRLDARLGTPRARVLALVLVLALAGLVRGIFFAQVSETEDFGRLAVDAEGYDLQARALLAGDWPGDEVYYQDALYPYFLAWHYESIGDEPRQVFVTQALLGVIAVGLVFLLASVMLGPTEGVIAGGLAATYGVFLFYETLLLKATLSTLCLTAFLVALVIARRRGLVSCFVCGALLGLSCLLRGNLLALLPIASLWLLWPREDLSFGRRAGRVTGLLLGTFLVILPVTLHNVRAGEFVLITSQAGQNFYLGNNPHNDTGSYSPPPGVQGIQALEQSDFARLAEEEVGHALSARERSRFWFDKSFHWFRQDPGGALRLQKKKLLLFLNHLEVPDNADYVTTREEVGLLRAPLPSFSVLLILACAALVLVRWTPELGLLVASGATISLTVVAFYVFSRYRLPVVPVLIVLASALPRAAVRVVRDRSWTRLALAVLVGSLAALVTYRDVWTGTRSMLHYNRALFAIEEEDTSRALEHLERAIELDAVNWYPLVLRGQLRAEGGDPSGGIEDLRAATRIAPGAAEPHYKLGLLLEDARDDPGARSAFLDALRAEPTYDVATIRLAEVERRLGEEASARARLEELLDRRRRFFPALQLLGNLLLESNELEEAERILERASRARPDDPAVQRDLARCRRALGRD